MKACIQLLFACCAITSIATGETFNFVSNDDGQVLASLTLQNLERSGPGAGVEDVIELAFTPDGQELFGYGPTYGGEFDEFTDDSGLFFFSELDGELKARSQGGISNSATLVDADPPPSSRDGFDETLAFGFGVFEGTGDIFLIYARDDDQQVAFRARGAWQIVPEPSTITLSLLPLLFALHLRRRRK